MSRSGLLPRLATMLVLCAVALPARATPSPRDKDGMAVLLRPDPYGVVAAIRHAVGQSGRFHLWPAKGIALVAQLPTLELQPPVTLRTRASWLKRTQARWLVFGTVGEHQALEDDPQGNGQIATASYDVALRVFDLQLGDTGPLFTGSDPDPAALAQSALKFLRANYPLQAKITAIYGDNIYLDVGKQDGIDQGSAFVIERHPGPYDDKVATVQVTSATDWFSVCQVEDQFKGQNPQVGDDAVEDTSPFLSTDQ